MQLNLADEKAVRARFRAHPPQRTRTADANAFEGVTVQPMVTEKGIELIIGSSTIASLGRWCFSARAAFWWKCCRTEHSACRR